MKENIICTYVDTQIYLPTYLPISLSLSVI